MVVRVQDIGIHEPTFGVHNISALVEADELISNSCILGSCSRSLLGYFFLRITTGIKDGNIELSLLYHIVSFFKVYLF